MRVFIKAKANWQSLAPAGVTIVYVLATVLIYNGWMLKTVLEATGAQPPVILPLTRYLVLDREKRPVPLALTVQIKKC